VLDGYFALIYQQQTKQSSGTLVQVGNVHGIFGALVIVLSNARDSHCMRMVALIAVTEYVQMAGDMGLVCV
jgi:hypothetical protein